MGFALNTLASSSGTRRDDPGSKPSMPMLTQSDVVPLTACGAFRGPGHGPRPERLRKPGDIHDLHQCPNGGLDASTDAARHPQFASRAPIFH